MMLQYILCLRWGFDEVLGKQSLPNHDQLAG